jgi:hypothetical protein
MMLAKPSHVRKEHQLITQPVIDSLMKAWEITAGGLRSDSLLSIFPLKNRFKHLMKNGYSKPIIDRPITQ